MRRIFFALFSACLLTSSACAADKNPVVVVETSMGAIKIELYQDKAPGTVKNFLGYVDDKFYDGTIFHRVMGKENTPNERDFMVQGGGFTEEHKEKKTKDPIKNESANGLSNSKYTVAMARTPEPDSATSQFYINVADNTDLDRAKADDKVGYCVFGKVIEGADVVDKIKAVKTGQSKFTVLDRNGNTVDQTFKNVPADNVVIKSIRRAENK
jgi:cyclophilin family peptidyl-prolyl cis-trans isomerase